MNPPLVRDPWFLLGLAIRVALIALVSPSIHTAWFVPFLGVVWDAGTLDIWSAFLAANGDPLAFPYGLPYLLVYGPAIWLAECTTWLGMSAGTTDVVAAKLLGITLLALDLALFRMLAAWTGKVSGVVKYYWLSPIVIFITYWYGQLDILPTLLLMAAIIAATRRSVRTSAVLLAAACAAKLSMLAAGPFFLIFLFRNRHRRAELVPFIVIGAATFLVLMAPILASPGAWRMVLQTREIQKIYELSLRIGDARIFIAPIAYAAIAYLSWNIRRIPSQLFVNILGIVFLPILLLTPASPGWFMWITPFLFLHQVRKSPSAILLTNLFAVFVVLTSALTIAPPHDRFGGLLSGEHFVTALGIDPQLMHDWLRTMMTTLGLLLTGQMLRDGILRNAHYQLERRRLAIGVAGDSGSGKDTLADAVVDLFGSQSVAHISGDDYHIWDRQRPMWSAITHLNPAANRLNELTRDTLRLASGASIMNRHYDHATGLMSRPRRFSSNDVVLLSGLHVLYPPDLRARLDLKVFLDMDDDLRRVLKIARDTVRRGQTEEHILESLVRRDTDRKRFIQPQRAHADIVFALGVPTSAELDRARIGRPFNMHMRITFDAGMPHEDASRLLIAMGVSVDAFHDIESQRVSLLLSGTISAADVAALSRKLIPDAEDYVELSGQWRDGWLGIMQLFLVLMLVNRFRRDVRWG